MEPHLDQCMCIQEISVLGSKGERILDSSTVCRPISAKILVGGAGEWGLGG